MADLQPAVLLFRKVMNYFALTCEVSWERAPIFRGIDMTSLNHSNGVLKLSFPEIGRLLDVIKLSD